MGGSDSLISHVQFDTLQQGVDAMRRIGILAREGNWTITKNICLEELYLKGFFNEKVERDIVGRFYTYKSVNN